MAKCLGNWQEAHKLAKLDVERGRGVEIGTIKSKSSKSQSERLGPPDYEPSIRVSLPSCKATENGNVYQANVVFQNYVAYSLLNRG